MCNLMRQNASKQVHVIAEVSFRGSVWAGYGRIVQISGRAGSSGTGFCRVASIGPVFRAASASGGLYCPEFYPEESLLVVSAVDAI